MATADPISSTVLTNQASATIPNVTKNTTIETKVTLPLPDKLATVSLCSLDKDHPCALLFAKIMARNAKSENLGSNVNPIDVDQELNDRDGVVLDSATTTVAEDNGEVDHGVVLDSVTTTVAEDNGDVDHELNDRDGVVLDSVTTIAISVVPGSVLNVVADVVVPVLPSPFKKVYVAFQECKRMLRGLFAETIHKRQRHY